MEPKAVPICTMGPSRPTEPPEPMDIAEASDFTAATDGRQSVAPPQEPLCHGDIVEEKEWEKMVQLMPSLDGREEDRGTKRPLEPGTVRYACRLPPKGGHAHAVLAYEVRLGGGAVLRVWVVSWRLWRCGPFCPAAPGPGPSL